MYTSDCFRSKNLAPSCDATQLQSVLELATIASLLFETLAFSKKMNNNSNIIDFQNKNELGKQPYFLHQQMTSLELDSGLIVDLVQCTSVKQIGTALWFEFP
jgi:hypothetical protein